MGFCHMVVMVGSLQYDSLASSAVWMTCTYIVLVILQSANMLCTTLSSGMPRDPITYLELPRHYKPSLNRASNEG